MATSIFNRSEYKLIFFVIKKEKKSVTVETACFEKPVLTLQFLAGPVLVYAFSSWIKICSSYTKYM